VVTLALIARNQSPAQRQRAIAALDRNINSGSERAWSVYQFGIEELLKAGQKRQALDITSKGFQYFEKAPVVWPDVIRFYGQSGNWDQAKKIASRCADQFPSYASACATAAVNPALNTQQPVNKTINLK
jgi:tetratricopeptide (TPR) repeat protein